MGVLMRCPHCGSTVEPARNVAGALLCPVCQNTGIPSAAPPAAASSPLSPLPPAPAATAPGAPVPGSAVASMVLGIVGVLFIFTLFLAPLSLVLGLVALFLGLSALRKLKAATPPGTRSSGRPIAVTGVATGAVSAVLGLLATIGLVVFFVWLAGFEPPEDAITLEADVAGQGGQLRVTDVSGFDSWDEFELLGTADCDLPVGDIDEGDTIDCYTDGSVRLREVVSGDIWYSGAV